MPDPNEQPPKEELSPAQIAAALFTDAVVTPPSEPTEPVDLRTIPRERWAEYLCFPVLLPPAVATYLAGMADSAEAMTVQEKDNLEEAVIRFHGVTEPYTIVIRQGVARLMRD